MLRMARQDAVENRATGHTRTRLGFEVPVMREYGIKTKNSQQTSVQIQVPSRNTSFSIGTCLCPFISFRFKSVKKRREHCAKMTPPVKYRTLNGVFSTLHIELKGTFPTVRDEHVVTSVASVSRTEAKKAPILGLRLYKAYTLSMAIASMENKTEQASTVKAVNHARQCAAGAVAVARGPRKSTKALALKPIMEMYLVKM